MRRITLLFLDITLLYASLLAMLEIRYDNQFAAHYRIHFAPFLIIFAIWLLVFFIAGLYDPRTLRNGIPFYSLFLEAIAAATVISTSFFYLFPLFGIAPKTNLALFIVIFTASSFVARSLFNRIVEKKFKKLTLIVCDTEQTRELAAFMGEHPQLGYTLKEIADP